MEILLGLVVAAIVSFVIWNMFRKRNERMRAAESESQSAAATGLSVSKDLFEAEMGQRAPLESFHVLGEEAQVTFDVPLGAEDDPVLNDLLLSEAVEVIRDRRQGLPIEGVHEIVVYAGRDPKREVARSKLAEPGELPPPTFAGGLSISNVARDPFAAPFDESSDHSVAFDMKVDTPEDELGRIIDELNFPEAVLRGLRSIGADPSTMNGPEFVVALLRMFGYRVTEQAEEGTYLAVKDGLTTFIHTEPHGTGHHPELEESVIQRFLMAFSSSGADRGMLITDKYGPFKVHEIESNQPKVKFITRERMQRFVDSMSLS